MATLEERINNLMGNVSPQKPQNIMRLNQGGDLQRAEPVNMMQPLPVQGDPFSRGGSRGFGSQDNSAMDALEPVGNFIKNRIGADDIQPTLRQFASTIDQKFHANKGSGFGRISIGGLPSIQPLPIMQPELINDIARPSLIAEPMQKIRGFAEGGMADMSQQEGMAEIEMSKEEAMQEIFIPLAENGYEQEVMAILNNPIDSEVSMQAQQVLAQVLSQDPEFDMNDFQMALSLVAPQ